MNHSGLYCYIPFCNKKCNYCDFYFTTSFSKQDAFVKALLSEIDLYCESNWKSFDTVYLGGGTPSALGAEQIEEVLKYLQKSFLIAQDAEITIEANPESASKEFLQKIKTLGVNRLSLGVQSFNDKLLKWMNRGHTAREAVRVIENIQKIGFEKWSMDLIHSIPGQEIYDYEKTLDQALKLNPPHISVYSMTIEEGTPLAMAVGKKKETPVSDDLSASLMRLTQKKLSENNFEHYEVSNFSREQENRSQHNYKYWSFVPYLGLGPSAHSYDGKKRWWNKRDMNHYIDRLNQAIFPIDEEEILTKEKQWIETIMLGLRKKDGLLLRELGTEFIEANGEMLTGFEEEGLVKLAGEKVFLTDEGFIFYNSIVESFLRAKNNITV